MEDDNADIIIIGGGPAGMIAGVLFAGGFLAIGDAAHAMSNVVDYGQQRSFKPGKKQGKII